MPWFWVIKSQIIIRWWFITSLSHHIISSDRFRWRPINLTIRYLLLVTWECLPCGHPISCLELHIVWDSFSNSHKTKSAHFTTLRVLLIFLFATCYIWDGKCENKSRGGKLCTVFFCFPCCGETDFLLGYPCHVLCLD